MEDIRFFLSDPVVGLVGYVLSFLSAVIAIWQWTEKSKALSLVHKLNIDNVRLHQENIGLQLKVSSVEVNQGDKSQYFQRNSGPVVIDNRG